jgi:hypothetical protein
MNERQIPAETQPPTAPEVRLDDELATPAEVAGDPSDFSAVGGPDSEAAYGRTRALDGEYPFNEHGGSYDRDEPAHLERGGIQTHHHAPDPAHAADTPSKATVRS